MRIGNKQNLMSELQIKNIIIKLQADIRKLKPVPYLKCFKVSLIRASKVLVKQQKPVHNRLVQKYSNIFCFFLAKQISDIVFNDTKSLAANQARDVIILADNTEYMNRAYHFVNAFGKEEIYDRIRLIGGFYYDHSQTSEYPLMVITNTVKIFKTRERRLRKMVASDGSSDETDNQEQNQQQFQSQGFLQSISSIPESSESIDNMFKSVNNKLQFQQQLHDIYEARRHIYESSTVQLNSIAQQQGLDHLICDFKDIDIQKTLKDYQRITQMRNAQSYIPLKTLAAKKPVFQSIIINEKTNELQNRYSAYIKEGPRTNRMKSNHLEFYNGEEIWDQNAPLGREKKQYLEYKMQRKHIRSSQIDNFNRALDLAERNKRRQKIRDKAAQLLTHVKSQDYVKGKPDFIKY